MFPEKVSHNGVEACLTEVINREHENVKYLPGVKLPENLVAEGDLALAVKDATILIFVLPHQVCVVSACVCIYVQYAADRAFSVTLVYW